MRNKIIALMLLGVCVLLISSCYKDKTVISDTGAEISRVVSFAADIQPLFDKSCNTSGCHSSGGKAPDLTRNNSYNGLVNSGYINTSEAAQSLLYLWMTGKKGTPMPMEGPNKDYNSLILAWIKQGAENN